MAFNPAAHMKKKKVRHVPVILLLDVSGSMSGAPIDELNRGVKDLLEVCGDPKLEKPVKVAVITFGQNGATLHRELAPAAEINTSWQNMDASGGTPLGSALTLAKEMVDDTSYMPKDEYYKGYFILVSDGEPNDEWEEPMRKLMQEGRTAKYDRFALAVGEDANTEMLELFVEGTNNKVIRTASARPEEIVQAFRLMSETINSNATVGSSPAANRDTRYAADDDEDDMG